MLRPPRGISGHLGTAACAGRGLRPLDRLSALGDGGCQALPQGLVGPLHQVAATDVEGGDRQQRRSRLRRAGRPFRAAPATALSPVRALAIGTAVTLAAIDLAYAPPGRISRRYLVDAGAEAAWVAAWLRSSRSDEAARGIREPR